MQNELRTIQGEVGITFVYVTHDQEEALTMSDRLAVFNNGRVEQVGAPADVYEHPANEFVAGFVGVSNIVERDGRRLTIRPEKVRILDTLEHAGQFVVEEGRIRDVSYAGMITRFVVELDRGGELQVVRQNLEMSSAGGTRAEGAPRARRLGRRARIRDSRERNNRGGREEDHRCAAAKRLLPQDDGDGGPCWRRSPWRWRR